MSSGNRDTEIIDIKTWAEWEDEKVNLCFCAPDGTTTKYDDCKILWGDCKITQQEEGALIEVMVDVFGPVTENE